MTLLLCPPPYGNAETSAATASQEASDPRFRAELDTLGGLRAGVEYTLRYECTAPCDSIRPPCFREPIETVGEATHYRGTRLELIDGRRRKYTTQGLSLRIRFTREGVAEVPSATTRIGGRKYATPAVRVRVGPLRQDLRDIRCRFELRPEHPQAGSEFSVALVCTARPDNGDPGIAADGLTFRRSGSGVQTGTDAPRYEYTFRVRAEREGRYTIRTAGLRFGGREYALSREVRIGRTGADAPDPDSPESRDARPATGRASDPEHPFFLLFGGLLTLMAAEWLAVRQFVRHECDEPLADFVLRTGRLPLTAWQASTHYGLPRPAAGGHSRHRRIHRRILPRDLRRLPVEMVRRAAARAGRHHGPPPVPQAPLHAGPHTAEGRGFRPPAGGAVPASRVGTAPLRHGLLRRTHAPRIPDPFVGRTALRRLRQRGGADQQHQRSGRAHGDLLLRPQPP